MKNFIKKIISFEKVVSVICVCTMVGLIGIAAKADGNNSVALENYELKALGRLQQDVDNSGAFGDNPEDFVYDADDLHAIEDLVKDGKTNLASTINTYPTGNVQLLDTFANFASAVDSLTEFPSGTYYYDSTTGTDDASELVRYIKENDAYYLCDQNGNKISDEAQTVDENNLVEYAPISEGNLTAGTAGMIDKSFVLGNGADNITYRNPKYKTLFNQSYSVRQTKTYTFTENYPYCLILVCASWDTDSAQTSIIVNSSTAQKTSLINHKVSTELLSLSSQLMYVKDVKSGDSIVMSGTFYCSFGILVPN